MTAWPSPSFRAERPFPCAPSLCRCDELAATSQDAAKLIAETWATFVTSEAWTLGNELHFRILELPEVGTWHKKQGHVETFLVDRITGATWSPFTLSHKFYLTDDITPHLKTAALLAQVEVKPPSFSNCAL